MKKQLLSFLFISLAIASNAQGVIKGQVLSGDEHVSFANVGLKGTSWGASADVNGYYTIENIPSGKYEIVFSALGYLRIIEDIEIVDNKEVVLNVNLHESSLELDQVVVTGTMKEVYVSKSPVKVEVITSKFLEKTIAPINLVQSVSLINGVQEVVACGVCYTNNISINGLPGPYTSILIDGSPLYGNLASVYGLNGIPNLVIDRMEVIKGPSSTLYGSEAVAGVINIITKRPENQPLLAFDIRVTTHLESFGNIALAPKIGKWNGIISADYAYINIYEDRNADDFGDMVNLDRISVFSKWSMQRKSKRKFTIAGKFTYEDRRNGVEAYLLDRAYQDIRGSDSIYGESIYTKRMEMFGTYQFEGTENFRLDYSFSTHFQNSYYGADFYEASQHIAYGNFIWNKQFKKHDITSGLTGRFQYYDDNTVATGDSLSNQASQQAIPGIFAQDEWEISKKLSTLAGARLDYYDAHGVIFSPRFSLKYKPGKWTTLRGNFGTGFRVVNLFTEDHAFITGNRQVEIIEDLMPERSYNGTLNLNHVYYLGGGQGSFDIDVFYTYFTNKIIPDYSDPEKIIYENTDGHATSKGISTSVNHTFRFPLMFTLGFNWLEALQTEANESGDFITQQIEYSPDWTSVITANYNVKKWNLNIAYSANFTGPMALPKVYDLDESGNPLSSARPVKSKAFSIHNLQITKSFKKSNWQLYIGALNILDYLQDYSPLVAYNDPNAQPGFSSFFDTAYAYSPMMGREFYLGVRWKLKR